MRRTDLTEGDYLGVCGLPGCGEALFYSGRGQPRRFCSLTHKRRAQTEREHERRGLSAEALRAARLLLHGV